MKHFSLALFLWILLCGPRAQAQDSTQRVQDLIAQAQAVNPAPPKGEMLVEACVVGAPENFVGFNRTTIVNIFENEGLVIERIRAYTWNGSATTAFYLRPGRVPLVEGPTALVKRAIVEGRWNLGAQGVSVLRPGESCHLYLPPGDWITVISRVPVTGAGFQVEAPDRCFNAGTGAWVECRMRVDTTGYGSPTQGISKCQTRANGAQCKIGPVGNWMDWRQMSKS